MKYLFIISLFLTACNYNKPFEPKYKIGDCIMLESYTQSISERESWEKFPSYSVEKILEIGKHKYRTKLVFPGTSVFWETTTDFNQEYIMMKVDCPLELRD